MAGPPFRIWRGGGKPYGSFFLQRQAGPGSTRCAQDAQRRQLARGTTGEGE